MKQFWFKGSGIMPLVVLMFFFACSCTDGYKDDWEWTSSVKNATLESPVADSITVRFSADGTTQTISWAVVPGAGGYQVSVYNNEDPDHPVLIGEENEIVDGLIVTRPAPEDTRFKVVIKALGNEKNNNKGSETASEKLYNNMLPVTAFIPNNTDLTQYFTDHPISDTTVELCYELEEGGSYTMTGNISQHRTPVTFRSGSKIHHATIAVTGGSFVNGGAGLKLRFIDMDCSATVQSSSGFILMDSNFPTTGLSGGYYFVSTAFPISLQACKIMGLKQSLFFDNSQKYAIGTILIKDCIIGQNTGIALANAMLQFKTGTLKDFTVSNSTLYNEQVSAGSNNRLMQLSQNIKIVDLRPPTEIWTGGSMTITNCTFYRMGRGSQSFNSNGNMGQATDRVTVQNNIFVDCYENGRIIARFRRSNTTAPFTGGQNTQFFDGLNSYVTGTNDIGSAGDNSYITSDPQLTYLGNGEFTMTGADQIAARTGDPRWLPAQ